MIIFDDFNVPTFCSTDRTYTKPIAFNNLEAFSIQNNIFYTNNWLLNLLLSDCSWFASQDTLPMLVEDSPHLALIVMLHNLGRSDEAFKCNDSENIAMYRNADLISRHDATLNTDWAYQDTVKDVDVAAHVWIVKLYATFDQFIPHRKQLIPKDHVR